MLQQMKLVARIWKNVHSVVSDAIGMNTGKKTGMKESLRDYDTKNFEHDAHAL